jgi:hypothetical protein
VRIVAAVCVLFAAPVRASDLVWVSVAGVTTTISRGDTPIFLVTVTNDSDVPLKLVDAGDHKEFQREFYQLVVTRGRDYMWRTESCDRPLPTYGVKYIHLEPQQSYTFTLSNYTRLFKELPAGDYEIAVRYSHWATSAQCHSTESNRIALTILK